MQRLGSLSKPFDQQNEFYQIEKWFLFKHEMKSSDLKTLWIRNAIYKCDFSMRRLIVDWLLEPKRIVALLLWTLKHWNTEILHMPFFLHRSGARESQYQTMCVFIAFRTVRFIRSICTHTIHRYKAWDVSILNGHPYPYSATKQFTHIWSFVSSQRRIIAILNSWRNENWQKEELENGRFHWERCICRRKTVFYSFLIGVQNIEWGESLNCLIAER